MLAHINVNWLSPVKVRTTLIGGEKKMVVWNDLEADEKVKVYDKGVEITNGQGVYDLLVSYRSGDMWAPKVDQTEALKLEAKYFVDCINKNETPFNDGVAGLRVVRLLEAAAQSLKERGRPVQRYERIPSRIAADVKLGKNVKLVQVHQPVRLRDRRQHQDRRLRRNPEERQDRHATARSPATRSSAKASPSRTTSSSATASSSSTTPTPAPRPPMAALQTEADWKVEPTLIRNGASIGSGATILSNVTVGENAMVGAGSVVTKDVPANTIVAGNPAQPVLRTLTAMRRLQNESHPTNSLSGPGHPPRGAERGVVAPSLKPP